MVFWDRRSCQGVSYIRSTKRQVFSEIRSRGRVRPRPLSKWGQSSGRISGTRTIPGDPWQGTPGPVCRRLLSALAALPRPQPPQMPPAQTLGRAGPPGSEPPPQRPRRRAAGEACPQEHPSPCPALRSEQESLYLFRALPGVACPSSSERRGGSGSRSRSGTMCPWPPCCPSQEGGGLGAEVSLFSHLEGGSTGGQPGRDAARRLTCRRHPEPARTPVRPAAQQTSKCNVTVMMNK